MQASFGFRVGIWSQIVDLGGQMEVRWSEGGRQKYWRLRFRVEGSETGSF